MKKLLSSLLFLTTIAAFAVFPPLSGSQILAENKKSSFVIVHTGYRSKYAADLLKEMLSAVTEAQLPVIHEKEYKKGTPAIFIGNTQAARSKKLIPRSYAQWEHRIDIEKNAVYLTGSDTFGDTLQRGSFESGMLKAVITFLEHFGNCCFFGPAPLKDYAAKQAKITLPDQYSYHKKPAIVYCISRSKQPEYDIATNAFYAGNFYKPQGGHNYPKAVPMAKYLKSNPEFFALRNGKRNPTRYNHLCISNPKVQELLYKNLLDQADAGSKMVQIGQTDSFQCCHCAPCRRLFGLIPQGKPGTGAYNADRAWKEKLWILHRNMAERFMKDRPGKLVSIMAYGPTQTPPETFKKFPSNTWIELAPFDADTIKQWKNYQVKAFSAYLYIWGTYNAEGFTPNQSFKALQAEVAGYYKHNIKGLYRCGFGELPGLSGPAYYIWGKLLGDPKADMDILLKQYCRYAFPKAAVEMEQFYKYLDSRLELQLKNTSKEDWNSSLLLSGQSRSLKPFHLFKLRYPEDVLVKLENLLKKAEAKEKNLHIKQVRTEFDYLRYTARAAQSMWAFRKDHSDAKWQKALADLEKREQFIKSIPVNSKGFLVANKRILFGQVTRPQVMMGGKLSAALNAPFNWGAVKLRKYNIKPCARVMKIDDPQWQYLVPQNRKSDIVPELRPTVVKFRSQQAPGGIKFTFVLANVKEKLRKEYYVRIFLGPERKKLRWFPGRFANSAPAWYKLALTNEENNNQGDKYIICRGRAGKALCPAPGVELAPGEISVEIFLPFTHFDKVPRKGDKWLLNVAAGVKGCELIWEYNMEQLNHRNATAANGTLIF